jgi:hypothetical protein
MLGATRLSLRDSTEREIGYVDSDGVTSLAMAEPWNITPLTNSWANVDPSAYSGHASFYRQPLGNVLLRGLIAGGTIGSGIMTLPVPYRPQFRYLLVTNSNNASGRLDVTSDGVVLPVSGSTAEFSLDALEFSATYPPFIAPTTENGWVAYDGTYNPPGYYRDATGMVHVRGLVKSGTAITVFTLPTGFRPPFHEVFPNLSSSGFVYTDVLSGGAVRTHGASGFSSLDTIRFHTSNDVWTVPVLVNGWANYGAGFAPAGFWKDPYGVVRLRGMIASGSPATVAFVLPPGYRPSLPIYPAAITGSAYRTMSISPNGNVTVGSGTSVAWYSLSGIAFRAAQ